MLSRDGAAAARRPRNPYQDFTSTEFFEASATVTYSQPDLGVGLEFRDVSRHFQPALHRWLLQAMREAVFPQNPSDPNS
jgi:hypothetical protein